MLAKNYEQSQSTIWENKDTIEEIRSLFAPNLSESEFKFFVEFGKATKLNPFCREVWCVKYDSSKAAQIFVGRDGYRKAAQAHSDYDYHQCDAVYLNDEFRVVNCEVSHTYGMKNRGPLIGAYCIVKRRSSSRAMYVFAELKEYSTGKSLWNPQTGKPATMIKKVAESQCLRTSFQDLLGGSYGEEEFSRGNIDTKKFNVIESSGYISPEKVSEDQINNINDLLNVVNFDENRMVLALNYYNVPSLIDLTYLQAQHFISVLNAQLQKNEKNKNEFN